MAMSGFIAKDGLGPQRFTFEPKPDITAYELAVILPLINAGRVLTEDNLNALGDAQRHLKCGE